MSEHATLAASNQPVNPQKQRKGLSRLWHALGYSLTGLRSAWHETAFRQEAIASAVLLSVLLCAGAWAAALFQRFVP